MGNTPLISVIIPVYKVEPYLRQCLDSVVNQTHRNLEIIVVDDGSPDNCGAICDEYAQKDSRFRVVHKENGGQSAAWNDALALATGDFVAFIDSDDWVDEAFFQNMLQVQDLDKADVIIANSYFVEKEDNTQYVKKAFSEPFTFQNGMGKDYLQTKVLAPMGHANMNYAWNKLYRLTLLKKENLLFDEEARAGLGNDVLFSFRVFGKAMNVKGIDCCGYHYRFMDTSGTRRYDPNLIEAGHKYLERFVQSMKSENHSPEVCKAFQVLELSIVRACMFSCLFHPENQESYAAVSRRIKEMKVMPRYHDAIYADNNEYLTFRFMVMKYALRQPFIWPLRFLFAARKKLIRKP